LCNRLYERWRRVDCRLLGERKDHPALAEDRPPLSPLPSHTLVTPRPRE
jgi:hypothetical protein